MRGGQTCTIKAPEQNNPLAAMLDPKTNWMGAKGGGLPTHNRAIVSQQNNWNCTQTEHHRPGHRPPEQTGTAFFSGGGGQDELVSPAHCMVTSRDQGSELPNSTMIPRMAVVADTRLCSGKQLQQTRTSIHTVHTPSVS